MVDFVAAPVNTTTAVSTIPIVTPVGETLEFLDGDTNPLYVLDDYVLTDYVE